MISYDEREIVPSRFVMKLNCPFLLQLQVAQVWEVVAVAVVTVLILLTEMTHSQTRRLVYNYLLAIIWKPVNTVFYISVT